MEIENYIDILVDYEKQIISNTNNSNKSPNRKIVNGVSIVDEAFLNRKYSLTDLTINVHIPILSKEFNPHRHDFFELIYILRGEIKNILDNLTINMKQGDFCLLNPNVTHAFMTSGEDDIAINFLIRKSLFNKTFFQFILSNDLFTNFFINSIYSKKINQDNYMFFSNQFTDEKTIERYITQILRSYLEPEQYSTQIIEFIISCMFMELTQSYKNKIEYLGTNGENKTKILEIIFYISENFKTATVYSTAKHFNYHPKYLPNMLKKYTQRNFTEIIQEFRLSYACVLLNKTKLNLDEIASEVGYSNRSYFFKVFRKKFGINPTDYRKNPIDSFTIGSEFLKHLSSI